MGGRTDLLRKSKVLKNPIPLAQTAAQWKRRHFDYLTFPNLNSPLSLTHIIVKMESLIKCFNTSSKHITGSEHPQSFNWLGFSMSIFVKN